MWNLNVRALFVFFLTLSAANAANILNVTLSPSTLGGEPGQTLIFSGMLENTTGSTVFINNTSYTFDIGGPGVVDVSPFLTNAPFSLTALETSQAFEFFTVEIPLLQAPGPYLGVFTVLGGADSFALDVIGFASFETNISPGVPEPATFVLLGGGLGLLIWTRRR